MSSISNDHKARLTGIFFFALLLLNYPLLALFGKETYLFGIPTLFVYIFFVWLCIIILVAVYSSKKKGE